MPQCERGRDDCLYALAFYLETEHNCADGQISHPQQRQDGLGRNRAGECAGWRVWTNDFSE